MNQSFKKKVIAASVAATFVAVGAGFVAIPGIAPISAAQANQFADTTQATAVTAGVNVPVSATAGLTGQTFVITENVVGAIGVGSINLTLSNGKWSSATAATTGTSLAVGGLQGQGTATLIVNVTASTTGATPGTITLSGMTLDTSSLTAGQTVSVSIASSSTATGVTTGVSTLLANVAAAGATITAGSTGTAIPTYPKLGSTVVSNTITVAEVIQGSIIGLTSTTDEITVTLPSGYTFLTAGATTDTGVVADAGTITSNVVKYDVSNTATGSANQKTVIENPTIFIPSTAADGNVDATVAVKLADGTTKTTTVTLFKVASAATTNLAYTTGTTTAPTTYSALYAGRATQSTGLDVAVKEVVGATLLAGGALSLTFPTGVTAGKNYTGTEIVADLTGLDNQPTVFTATDGTADETGKNSIQATLHGTDADTVAGKVTFKLDDLDLGDTAVVGDLNVTVGGTANATAGTVKVATVIRATDSSVSGAIGTVTAGASLSLPDIVITESKAGALVGGGALMGVYMASANGAALTTTGATVVAKKADGTDVSTTIFGAASATLTASGANGLVTFPVTTASSSTTGPVTITISGLKATMLSTATAGDVTALVGGASATNDITLTSDEGAKAFKQTVTVGKIVSSTVPSIPAATATGTNTALTLSGSVVASGNDQGKIGTLFVVAVMQNGQIYSRDAAGGWTLWDGVTAFKSVEAGVTLGTHSISILSTATNVSTIVGTQVYAGYGIGALGNSAFNNLLANATYAKVYTVQ